MPTRESNDFDACATGQWHATPRGNRCLAKCFSSYFLFFSLLSFTFFEWLEHQSYVIQTNYGLACLPLCRTRKIYLKLRVADNKTPFNFPSARSRSLPAPIQPTSVYCLTNRSAYLAHFGRLSIYLSLLASSKLHILALNSNSIIPRSCLFECYPILNVL